MLKQLIDRIALLDNKTDSEENLKIVVTRWMLIEMGYDELLFDYEHPLCRRDSRNKHADIFIPVEPGKALFVETKKYSKDLDEEDVIQLAEYLNMSPHEIAWGILTNGRQLFLLNNSIDIYGNGQKNFLDKLVMRVEYNPVFGQFKNGDYINYFSMESIYKTGRTNYFKAISQFFAKHNLSTDSKERYQNTLWQFFDYYVKKGNNYVVYGGREYGPLEEIKDKDFIDFLKSFKSTTRKASGKPPLTKCSHIVKMYEVMENIGCITNNTMKNLRNRVIAEYEKKDIIDNPLEILDEVSINIVLDRLKNKPYKMIIFTLASYYGLSRDKIALFMSQPWECINFDKDIFTIKQKPYPLVKILKENLIQLKEDYKKKGLKKPSAIYLFKKNGVYSTVGTDSINAVFDEIKKYNDDGVNWKLFNPQNARASAIYRMLCSGCSIEEIAYISDSPVQQLIKYLPDDIVDYNGARKWRTKIGGKEKHPFKDSFDN